MSNKRKNLRKIPEQLLKKIKTFGSEEIIVAAARKLKAADIQNVQYVHAGIKFNNGGPTFESRFTPTSERGRYSKWNMVGRTIVRKDLPKAPKTYTWIAPNFGDWDKGTHIASRTRDVFPREFHGPKFIEIGIDLLDVDANTGEFTFAFKVLLNIDPSLSSFERELIFCLNLLQENFGIADVFPHSATDEDFLKSVYSVDWEILPPGERATDIAKISFRMRVQNPEEVKILSNRYDLIKSLGPTNIVYGISGFQRYFGAEFGKNLIVLECLRYGNAIYVMFENWQDLSKLSRVELLNSRNGEFERIVHKRGWEEILRKILKEKGN